MIIYILFPGFGISEKQWKYEIILKNKKYELKKIEFLKNLKKIGKVFKYTPKAYNYNYYLASKKRPYEDGQKLYQDLFEKPEKIKLDDININKECVRIYEYIKNESKYKYEKEIKFIPIGHSIGSWFCLHFSNIYKSECLKIILFDGQFLIDKYIHNVNHNINNEYNLTNEVLETLHNKVLVNVKINKYRPNPEINKIIDKINNNIICYYYKVIKNELNGDVKVPVVSFRYLSQNNKEHSKIYNYEDDMKSYNPNYKTHYLINFNIGQFDRANEFDSCDQINGNYINLIIIANIQFIFSKEFI